MSLNNDEDLLVSDQLVELPEGLELPPDYDPIGNMTVTSSGDEFAYAFDNIDKSDIIDTTFFDNSNSIIESEPDIGDENCDNATLKEQTNQDPSVPQETSQFTTHLGSSKEKTIVSNYKCKFCYLLCNSALEMKSHYRLEHSDQDRTPTTRTKLLEKKIPTTKTQPTTTTKRKKTKRKRLLVKKKKIVKKVINKKEVKNKSPDVDIPRRYPCEWPNCTYVAKHSVRSFYLLSNVYVYVDCALFANTKTCFRFT